MKQDKSNTKKTKAEILKYIEETYVPEKTSMGNEAYSGTIDSYAYSIGWITAKGIILQYLKDVL